MTKNEEVDNFMEIIKEPATRIELVKRSHFYFFHTYFSEHVTYPIAPFHREMFRISEDEDTKLAVIVSFRGSGKSTLMTLSFPLWAVLGNMKRKFIVIISQTQEQARQHFKNLKSELESNELLRRDLGPFVSQNEWNNCSLIIPKYNAKIVAVSRDQSFRGAKFGSHRPDLIIADDCEDMNSVKTPESRKNTRDWFMSEVLPLGDKNTKIIVVGNLLNKDSLLMNLQKEIEDGSRSGIFRKFPLLNSQNQIAWPGKYPDMKAIEEEKKKIGNKFVWAREYLLDIIDDFEPIVNRNSLHLYDQLPPELRDQRIEYVIGVDLALSEERYADYTALVSAKVYFSNGKMEIYILPNPMNYKGDINKTLDNIKELVASYGGKFNTRICVENTMLQGMFSQFLDKENYRAEAVNIGRMDKSERLHFSSRPIHLGEVFFPRFGCEELIEQIVDFKLTGHDDLLDAFTILILRMIEKKDAGGQVQFVNIVRDKIDSPEKCHSRQDWGKFIDNETEAEFSHSPQIGRNRIIRTNVHRGAVGMGIAGNHSYEFIDGIPRPRD